MKTLMILMKKKKEIPSHGPRSNPCPVICIIDFENNSLSGSSFLEDITEYEIWDESYTICISSMTHESYFVQFVKDLPNSHTYILKLKGVNFTYFGNFYNKKIN